MFADTSLARRIERAEGDLLREAAAAIERRTPDGAGFVLSIAGGVAAFTEPGSPLNKVFGLGFEGPPEAAELDELEALYRARGATTRVEVSTLADPSTVRVLSERGYRLVGFENLSGRALDGEMTAEPIEGVEVEASPPSDLETWLDVTVAGFVAADEVEASANEAFDPEILRRIIRDFAGGPGMQRYLAGVAGEPAGTGALHVSGDIAVLCGAATLPELRRRGVQTALVRRRLAAAAEAGAHLVTVTTEPGSRSQQNVHRRGFALLYARAVLELEPR